LSKERKAELAGTIVGILEKAQRDLGKIPELQLYLEFALSRAKWFMERTTGNDRDELERMFSRARGPQMNDHAKNDWDY